MNIAFKYEIFPDEQQLELLPQMIGNVRFIWNKALAMRKEVHETHGYWPSYKEMAAWIPGWRAEYDFLALGDSTSYQQTLRHLDKAVKDYIKSLKGERKGPKLNPPRRKRRKTCRWSYKTTHPVEIDAAGGKIKLLKLGWVNIALHRPYQGRITSATISMDRDGRCYVSLQCEVDTNTIKPLPKTGKTTGFDLNLGDFLVTHTGEKYQGYKLAAAYSKERRRRNDMQHKLAWKLICENDTLVAEKLVIKDMVNKKKRKKKAQKTKKPLSYYRNQTRKILGTSWGGFLAILANKAAMYDRKLILVEPAYTSQTCHQCGYIEPAVADTSVRQWTCIKCGVHHDRDINAAKNILQRGCPDNFASIVDGMDCSPTPGNRENACAAKRTTDVGVRGQPSSAITISCKKERSSHL